MTEYPLFDDLSCADVWTCNVVTLGLERVCCVGNMKLEVLRS